MKHPIYYKLPNIIFIALYEYVEKETRNHDKHCCCSKCIMFYEMSCVAEIRYDHDEKVFNIP